MAIPVARVHLAMAHAALPALLPTPPKWKMLPLLSTPPCPCVATAILPKPLAKPSLASSGEKWDARKTKPASAEPSASSSSSGPRSADSIRSSAGHGSSSPRKNATTSPSPKPGRADSVKRWDVNKKAASPASSSSSSSSGSGTTSPLVSSSSKWPISRATSSAERWDVHKERRPPQADQRLDDGESSSSGSGNDDIDTEEEEILWKPRAMYAGPRSLVAAPECSMLPMPTALLVPVA